MCFVARFRAREDDILNLTKYLFKTLLLNSQIEKDACSLQLKQFKNVEFTFLRPLVKLYNYP